MNAALLTAWVIIASATSGQVILSKQIRVDPRACHLPTIRAEYPLDGQMGSGDAAPALQQMSGHGSATVGGRNRS